MFIRNVIHSIVKKDDESGVNGSQIDLLIVRKDQIINLFEIKFSNVLFPITEKTLHSINNKINDLRLVTKTKYAKHPTLVTLIGLKDNSNALSIQAVITLDDLF